MATLGVVVAAALTSAAEHDAISKSAMSGTSSSHPADSKRLKKRDDRFLLTLGVGGIVSLLSSVVGLVLSLRVISKTTAIVGDSSLEPERKAALLSDAIDSATGWTHFALLAWPIGSLLVSVIALGWLVVRHRR